ncbi:DUF3375 domain-containing protein [Endozoicomonas elysicola]|uniref:DUF3375 domain-containing protein n=1 Tax=Endozoicomonas elysicola TaxID=305900 RepID=A0A081KFR8_9GAMM|nr:DUF3375 domain-containing protein [Endozoicomonas elysicola]KEI72994.1 hypothetical protein GV64_21760 [Endozoicomonas elysicola]
MLSSDIELSRNLVLARTQNPAWRLLASPRAPLMISCLKTLFYQDHETVSEDAALHVLAEILGQFANHDEFSIDTEDLLSLAKKEMREWRQRNLIVEREGQLFATDALQQAMQFIDGMDNRMMTSTASRLATVQREIDSLEAKLNPDQTSRANNLTRKIESLKHELEQVNRGEFKVLEGPSAVENIREVYNLSMTLKSDFRRVEDSYREADKQLRQTIISEQHHRGEIVDRLLDSHDHLLTTPEGQVFHGFYEQLSHSIELDNMKHRLRNILSSPSCREALTQQQSMELRWLTSSLVRESEYVIRARARSERDVKGFLKSGLAVEHHRVGQMLNEILECALNLDWHSQKLRRSPAPLKPLAFPVSGLPLIERLTFKPVEQLESQKLVLSQESVDLDELDDDFWNAFDGLDRETLIRETIALLKTQGTPMTIAQLAEYLPPTHDLETLALWLSMAREAGLIVADDTEQLDIQDRDGQWLRFYLPKTYLHTEALTTIDWEL